MKVKIVIDKNRDGFKAIVERENSENRFYPSHPNVKISTVVQPVESDELLIYLDKIGVPLSPNASQESIQKVVNKFRNELCIETNLCYDEVGGKGAKFWKLTDLPIHDINGKFTIVPIPDIIENYSVNSTLIGFKYTIDTKEVFFLLNIKQLIPNNTTDIFDISDTQYYISPKLYDSLVEKKYGNTWVDYNDANNSIGVSSPQASFISLLMSYNLDPKGRYLIIKKR